MVHSNSPFIDNARVFCGTRRLSEELVGFLGSLSSDSSAQQLPYNLRL